MNTYDMYWLTYYSVLFKICTLMPSERKRVKTNNVFWSNVEIGHSELIQTKSIYKE